MGFDVNRFVGNIDKEFICDICNGVLEEPVVVKICQHLFCTQCIRNHLKTSSICPKDMNSISLSQLIEPQKVILNLLNGLKIKCEFTLDGCKEVVPLEQLDGHQRCCQWNPLCNKQIKCICGQKFARKELVLHKEQCLPFIKNQIHINRLQISSFMSDIISSCGEKVSSKRFNSEAEYLYHKLKQSLPQRTRNQNSIQNILLYMSWYLLNHSSNSSSNSDQTLIQAMKLGLRDLKRATIDNKEAIITFIRLDGFDFIYLTKEVIKKQDINQSISEFLLNFCEFDYPLRSLTEKQCLDLLLSLLNHKVNGIECSFNCVEILAQIIVRFNDIWNDLSSVNERTAILRQLKTTIDGWKLNLNLSYNKCQHFDDMKVKLKKQFHRYKQNANSMPQEVLYRYVWLMVWHIRAQPKIFVPFVEEENVIPLMKSYLESHTTEPYLKDFIELLFHQIETFKRLGHLNGLENSDKRKFETKS